MSRGSWKISRKNNPSVRGFREVSVQRPALWCFASRQCHCLLSAGTINCHCVTAVSSIGVWLESNRAYWPSSKHAASQMGCPSSTVVLGKRPGTELFDKSSAAYWTRMFITVITRARYWTLSWARLIKFKHFNTLFKPQFKIVLLSQSVTSCKFPD